MSRCFAFLRDTIACHVRELKLPKPLKDWVVVGRLLFKAYFEMGTLSFREGTSQECWLKMLLRHAKPKVGRRPH